MKFKIRYIHILFIITAVVLVRGCIRSKKLESNYILTTGRIVMINLGSNNGGTIQYIFPELGLDQLASDGVGYSSCISLLNNRRSEVVNYEFPVAYLISDIGNSQILLFEDQYEDLDLEVPVELGTIVKELSECR